MLNRHNPTTLPELSAAWCCLLCARFVSSAVAQSVLVKRKDHWRTQCSAYHGQENIESFCVYLRKRYVLQWNVVSMQADWYNNDNRANLHGADWIELSRMYSYSDQLFQNHMHAIKPRGKRWLGCPLKVSSVILDCEIENTSLVVFLIILERSAWCPS